MISSSNSPLITIGVLAYNQEGFIREAIKGAFSQTYSPLEIILSDDCSYDQTFPIINEMAGAYRGPHTIIVNRNDHNLGIGAHVNRIMEIAKGELFVAAAGDDISLPKRVEKIYEAYEISRRLAKSLYSKYILIDEAGRILEREEVIRNEELSPEEILEKVFVVPGCSHAWNRQVFEVFGPMRTPLTCEDVVISLRSSLLGEIQYIEEPLVMHRRHDRNVWNYHVKQDLERDISSERFLILEYKAIFENWLRDLNRMKDLGSIGEKELEYFMGIVRSKLLNVEKDIILMSGSWSKRCKMLSRYILEGADFKTVRHKIGVFMFPEVYRQYMRIKIRIKSRKNGNVRY